MLIVDTIRATCDYESMQTNATPTNATSSTLRGAIAQWMRERESVAQRQLRERMERQSRGTPPKRKIDRATRPNEWEIDGPRNVHRDMDRACHHPLVKCVHKW